MTGKLRLSPPPAVDMAIHAVSVVLQLVAQSVRSADDEMNVLRNGDEIPHPGLEERTIHDLHQRQGPHICVLLLLVMPHNRAHGLCVRLSLDSGHQQGIHR